MSNVPVVCKHFSHTSGITNYLLDLYTKSSELGSSLIPGSGNKLTKNVKSLNWYSDITKSVLTLVMLIKLRRHTHFQLSANQIT